MNNTFRASGFECAGLTAALVLLPARFDLDRYLCCFPVSFQSRRKNFCASTAQKTTVLSAMQQDQFAGGQCRRRENALQGRPIDHCHLQSKRQRNRADQRSIGKDADPKQRVARRASCQGIAHLSECEHRENDRPPVGVDRLNPTTNSSSPAIKRRRP